jgi:hypothetical protein
MLRRATFAKVSAELLKIRQKDAATYTRCGSAATFQKFSTHNLSPLTLAQLSWRASRPRDRGVSAASRTWGGERWPGNDVALEMRRDGPAVQAADVPARPPRGPRAVVSQPDNPQGEKGCLKWKSTGGAAEQAYKHRARDAGRTGKSCGDYRLCALPNCTQGCGVFGPGVPRALAFFARQISGKNLGRFSRRENDDG